MKVCHAAGRSELWNSFLGLAGSAEAPGFVPDGLKAWWTRLGGGISLWTGLNGVTDAVTSTMCGFKAAELLGYPIHTGFE